MSEIVFCKLGGSLITEKSREATARPEVIQRLAREVKAALAARPDLRLLLGHGSGSFGHILAHRYQVHKGCTDWYGYAATGAIAARLNRLVTDAFLAEGVPVVSFQPSASARARGGQLLDLATAPIQSALEHGLVPLLYGDVAFDETQGSTILSTEQLFAYLDPLLRPMRILLAGEVSGVFTADPQRDVAAQRIPEIHSGNLAHIRGMLGGSAAIDVTGGMLSKVLSMYALACQRSSLTIQLLSGLVEGAVQEALQDPHSTVGTRIYCRA